MKKLLLITVLLVSVMAFSACEEEAQTTASETTYVESTPKYCQHVEVIDSAIEATCTTPGKTEGSHCSECGEVLVEQEEVTKTHEYSDYKCVVCGEKSEEYDEIVKLFEDNERYYKYLKADIEILKTSADLYKLNPSASNYSKVVNTVSEMYEYVNKIYDDFSAYSEFELLNDACLDVEIPTKTGRSFVTSATISFSSDCISVYVTLEHYANKFGVFFD